MNRIAFKSLIDSVLSVKAWIDTVPEGKSIPAASFSHISNGGVTLLSGRRTGVWDTWRVSITGKNRKQCDDELEKLKALNNTQNNDFSRVLIVSIGDVESGQDDPVTMAYIDFRTYDR